jgi:hypothetical protein
MAKGRRRDGTPLGGRKPVHQVAAGGHLTAWSQIWADIRANRAKFSAACIEHRTKLSLGTIRNYVKRLQAHGFIVALEDQPRGGGGWYRWTTYKLVRDVGVEAPRLQPDGSLSTAGSAIDRLWRSMRILREFSAIELAAAATTDTHSMSIAYARIYVRALHRARVLRMTSPSGHGPGAAAARFQLVPAMNTGPKALMLQRGGAVFDPNLMRSVWQPKKN